MLVSLAAWLQSQGPEFGWLRVVQYLTFRDTSEPQTLPASVGEFRERYRKVDGRWLFARREIVPVFGGRAAAAHAARVAGQEGSAR